MSLKTSLKRFFVEHRARWSTEHGQQRAMGELSTALQKDDPEVLEQALSDSSRWLTQEEIDGLEFKINFGGSEPKLFSWKGALIAAGRWHCVEWALGEGKINPNEVVTRSGLKRTFKQLLWTKFSADADMSYWVGHAKAHPEAWRPEWERLKGDAEAKDLGWLKILFAQEQEFERYRQSLVEASVPELSSQALRAGASSSFTKLLGRSEFEDRDALLLSYAKAWNEDPSVLDNKEFFHELVSSLGPSTSAYKGFVELGWCSLEDVQEFQDWVGRYDKTIQNVCQTWGRPDLVAWVEKERLSKRVGHGVVVDRGPSEVFAL